MASEKLFDESPRSDSRPGRHTEKPFHFLNRRAGPVWDRVRDHVESCYAAFPDDHKPNVVGRLRDDDERQHLPAWWELYTFTLFDRLGYEIEVHPELPGSTKNPDFLVTKGPVSMYVEAAVVFNDDLKSDAWNWVCDCVNDVKNPDFMVDLEIPTVGKHRPGERDIQRPLEEWLAKWDADQVLADQAVGLRLPRTQLSARDWVLDYTAAPVSPDRRGMHRRLIGIYPIQAVDFRRDVKRLRKTLKDKGSNYSKLDEPLDKPQVTAITSWNPLHHKAIRRKRECIVTGQEGVCESRPSTIRTSLWLGRVFANWILGFTCEAVRRISSTRIRNSTSDLASSNIEHHGYMMTLKHGRARHVHAAAVKTQRRGSGPAR